MEINSTENSVQDLLGREINDTDRHFIEAAKKAMIGWCDRHTSFCRGQTGKKLRRTTRELTTPLFLLRCMEVGISIRDLDLLTIGLVMDIWLEKRRDGESFPLEACQKDFDSF